jgi:bacteriocin-like protein
MQEPYQDKVKLLPEELTEEELEQVVGGMSDGAFQAWKVDYLNNFLHQLYDNKREVERQSNPV